VQINSWMNLMPEPEQTVLFLTDRDDGLLAPMTVLVVSPDDKVTTKGKCFVC
jgi:hypothetical protein